MIQKTYFFFVAICLYLFSKKQIKWKLSHVDPVENISYHVFILNEVTSFIKLRKQIEKKNWQLIHKKDNIQLLSN